MGRLEDIEKRNKKSLAILNVVEGGLNATQGRLGATSSNDPKIPSKAFSRYFGICLVVAFFVLVALTLIF